MINQTISHFKILEKLGEGGMGVVYKAQDLKLDRLAALKFLPPEFTRDPHAKERFINEAKAASALDHPNICTVYEIGDTAEQRSFIAMAYYEGETLSDRIKRGALEVNEAITIALQVVEGLKAAHEQKIIHRDIKSSNIMLTAKGQLKIMDFGLARRSEQTMLTKTGSTLGTVPYMSPEQARGEQVDHRTDIWSLGVVLYEMISGRLPFQSPYSEAIVYSILNEDPPALALLRSNVPAQLDQIILKALQKDPSRRCQTAADFLADLTSLQKQLEAGIEVPVARMRAKKKRHQIYGGVALLAALIVVIALVIFVFRKTFSVVKANSDMRVTTLRTPFADITYPALSQDGRWVAFGARDPDGRYDVYLANTSGGTPRRITSDTLDFIGGVDISPDVNSIVYDGRKKDGADEIWTAATLGGGSHLLVQGGLYPRWRPDGKRIGYVRMTERKGALSTEELWSIDASGRDNHLEFVDSVQRIGFVSFSFAPDGNSLAWFRSFGHDPNTYGEIVVRNLASGEENQLTHDKAKIEEISWTSSDIIVFSSTRGGSRNLWFVPVSGGDPVQLTRGPGPDGGVKVSKDGERLIYTQSSVVGNVSVLNVERGNVSQVTYDEDRLALDPAISPDGKSIAYSMSSADFFSSKERDLYVVDRDGSNQRKVTLGGLVARSPIWSPDGKWIAYSAWGGTLDSLAHSGVFLLASNGQTVPKRLIDGHVRKWLDSNTLIVNKDVSSWLVSLYGSPARRFFRDSCSVGEISDNYVSYWDLQNDHRGPWIIPRHLFESTPDDSANILKSSIRYERYPKDIRYIQSQNGRGLYSWKADGSIWEMKFPEGTMRQLKGTLPSDAGMISMSYQRNELAFVKTREVNRLFMIEKPFSD